MFKPLLLTAISVGVLLVSAASYAAAQNGKDNNNKNDERRENEAVQKAQKDADAAKKALNEVEKSAKQAADKIKDAERDQAKASSHLQKQGYELEAKHADLLGLTEARRTLNAARSAYEKSGKPVLEAVAESDKYKAAVEAASPGDSARRQGGRCL